MKGTNVRGALLAAGVLSLVSLTPSHGRDLTFEERVKAQEALDRVYYAHQVGATRSFEEAVPRTVLERKVRDYLRQTVALESFWKTPITAGMLQAEVERMARGSRMPERLRELYAALGNDPILVEECLSRPVLVDRLAHTFFASDPTIQRASRERAEALRGRLVTRELDPAFRHDLRTIRTMGCAEAPTAGLIDAPRPATALSEAGEVSRTEYGLLEYRQQRSKLPAIVGEIGPLLEERDDFAVDVILEETPSTVRVATYRIPKRTWDDWWPTVSSELDEAALHLKTPSPETASMARAKILDDGPHGFSTDSWTPTSTLGAPSISSRHGAVWTGSVMIVWGSNGSGRYDPATDTWASISMPADRVGSTLVWTGSLAIGWGGSISNNYPNVGVRYDPMTNSWTSTSPGVQGRTEHTAVWTGSHMIVWGGMAWDYSEAHARLLRFDSGGRYDPITNSWGSTAMAGAPDPRYNHSAVWAGTSMIVWGGLYGLDTYYNTGGRYDPVTNTWTATSVTGAPVPRSNPSIIWSGNEVIIWGGAGTGISTGGRYNPATNSWTPTSTTGAPSASDYTAIWSGNRMIVFGGSPTSAGVLYDPTTDTWKPTSTSGAPSPRYNHAAVWTGNSMIIWGGSSYGGGPPLISGGLYSPDGSAAAKPVPDGRFVPGTQMRAAKNGGAVDVTWDASTCPAQAYSLYYGSIPNFASLTGSVCALPPTGSSAGVELPNNSFWVMVGQTAGAISSFGQTSSGTEESFTGWPGLCSQSYQVTNAPCP